jgi:hypothetical protein
VTIAGRARGAAVAVPDSDALSSVASELRAHPTAASVLLGCAGIGALMVIGAGELAVGIAASVWKARQGIVLVVVELVPLVVVVELVEATVVPGS